MAHIQDRWYRDKKDPDTGEVVTNAKGKPVQEKTEQYGIGLRYKVRWVNPDKRERSKSFPDGKLTEAKQWLIKVTNDMYAGTYSDPNAGNVTFREYSKKVLAARSQDESTVYIEKSRMRSMIYPFLGDKLISSFKTPTPIREWLGWMHEQNKGLSVTYERILFRLVSSILDAAVDDEMLKKNPCRSASVQAPRATVRKVVPWDESRLWAVEDALPERFKPCIGIGAGLGLRQGEVFAFSLDKVDRKEMVYNCDRQLVTVGGVRKFKLPKGHKVRQIPIGQALLDDLDEYVERFPSVKITLPWAEKDGKEFETVNVLMVNKHGELYKRTAFNFVVWQGAFRAAGLSYENHVDGMHALRHLFASAMLARGVSIKELAAYLGHHDEGFTLRTYTHLMTSSHERARAAVNDLFGGRPVRKNPPCAA